MPEKQRRGRGRPRLSVEEKARRKAERDAAKGLIAASTYSDDELFNLLRECEPRIGEAQRVAKVAAEGVKREREVLAIAFGGMAVARRKLDLCRRAHTAAGEAEAHELIEMRARLRKVCASGQADQDAENRIVSPATEVQAANSANELCDVPA